MHQQPEHADYRAKLADAHSALGDLYSHQTRFEESDVQFHQALKLAERLAREKPGMTSTRSCLREHSEITEA